ncbi:conserved hypothetical protein [Rhodopseudomonas palustris TIE-1]|nr:conserved hypothetical protein [Rhodopseudomonas palustris TIE-1]
MPGSKRVLRTNLAKLDRHVITPEEYEEIPELTDEWFAAADHHRGGKLIKRGRPKAAAPKQLVSLRLDPDVLHWFKSTGPGYQARMGEVLKSHMSRKKAAGKKA